MKALLLLLFSAGKLSKLMATGGTMLLSIVAYAFVFGWWYAVGFVLLIFFHEMGHYLAAKQRNLPVGAPTFIPFVGAWIDMKEMPKDVETEAYVGIAGPLFGTLAALVCYYIARGTGSQLMMAIAYSGFFLNLFNLIPVSPLDGGRITAIISPKIWLLGAPALLLLYLYRPSPMLIILAVLAVPQLMKAWNHDPADEAVAAYYTVSAENKLTYTVFYLGLVIFLSVMTYDVHNLIGGV